MWLLFAVLSLIVYAVADLLGKKTINDGGSFLPIKLCISSSLLSFIISLLIFAFHLGESGLYPWQILIQNPHIIVNLTCFFLYWTIYLMSMKFIRLSYSEAISGSVGVFYFVGLLLINLLSGKLPSVLEMLHPLRLVPVILVLVGIILYPSINYIGKNKLGVSLPESRRVRLRSALGVIILLVSLILDSIDSLLTAMIIDDGKVGIMDYLMSTYFITIVPVLIFMVIIRVKEKKWYIPFISGNAYSHGYGVASLLASFLYILASQFDAVRTGLLFLTYPVVPIIGARIFLKEKQPIRQSICVWVITIAAIVFCVVDYLI